MALSEGFNYKLQQRHFVRINDKFIRFDNVKSVTPIKMYETDCMALIEIEYFDGSKADIKLFPDKWMQEKECAIDLNPKIQMVVDFIENAIDGNLQEYFIEF